MLVASIITLITSILFFVSNRTSTNNRIFASMLFIVAIGVFGSYMEFDLIPHIKSQGLDGGPQIIFLEYLCSFLLSCGHFVPYSGFLLFSIYFAGYMNGKKLLHHLILILLVMTPTIVTFILFPVQRQFKPDFAFLSAWTGVYLFASTIIQWRAYKDAITASERNDRLFVFVLLITGIYMQYFIVFITQAFGNKEIWHYSPTIVAVAFTVYLVFAIRFGVFGLQIRFEKRRMDTALKAINSSTLIYNHAVKNEIAKISLCAQTILSIKEKIENEEFKRKIGFSAEIIKGSTNHLLNLVDKIKEGTRLIELNETEFSLRGLIEDTLKGITSVNSYKSISFKVVGSYDYKIKADYTHVRECFSNIIKNAIEAVGDKGNITVSIDFQVRFLVLAVEDNGQGIPEEKIQYLFDPFYSTKVNGNNFGLGLFYCYNVMRKHGGNIEVKSVLNSRTVVSLIFPSKRVLARSQTLAYKKV